MGREESVAIVVGPKGRGTNMRAIIEASRSGQIPAPVRVVVSPNDTTAAAEYARNQNIRVDVVTPGEDYGPVMTQTLSECSVICLAGYTRLLPEAVLDDHPGRVLNIHPALLPKFGGKGMYGIRVHEAVIAQGETESGCTVHYVTSHYDEGQIILQKRCPVLPSDTPEELAARVLNLEQIAYPEAIAKVIRGTA